MFNNTELKRQYSRIESLISQARKMEPDDELRAHLTKYICVLCSGFIENSMYHIFSDIADKLCSPSEVLTYAKIQLSTIQNPNSEKIRKVVKSFSNDWHERISVYLQNEDRASAVNYILKDRHNIAHGRDSDITIGKLEGYLKKTVEVLEFIENGFSI